MCHSVADAFCELFVVNAQILKKCLFNFLIHVFLSIVYEFPYVFVHKSSVMFVEVLVDIGLGVKTGLVLVMDQR